MPSVKVVVTGPFGAGKTTLIRTISEVSVLSTERDISDHTRSLKGNTTVAMDFGRITVDRDAVLFLFGTPGQERFDFMWDILAEGMLGFVLVTDASRKDSFEAAAKILRNFRGYETVPFVVAVNKYDSTSPEDAVEETRRFLDLGEGVPVLPMNALDKDSVKEVLLALLHAVLAEFENGRVVKSA